jgi:hypothetical protein
MTNLTDKFDSVLDLLISQNTAMQESLAGIQATLDAIATAIGAPPPGGATLQDVVDQLQIIDSDLNTFSTDMHNLVTVTNDRLETIAITAENIYFGQLDTQNIILATACPCDNDLPPLPEPPADFPQPEQGLYCQRIQYMLDQFETELTDLAAAKASGPVSSTIVNEILGERASVNSVDAPSNASISGTVSGLNSASGDFLTAFAALRTDLMFAIFEQTTTGGAKEAYDTVVTSGEGSFGPLFRNIAYQGWFNALFDSDVVIWPVDSYDDGACQNETEYPNTNVFTSSPGESIALWSPPIDMIAAPPSTFDVYLTDQVYGWTLRNDSAYNAQFAAWNSSNTLIINTTITPGNTYTFNTHFDHGYVGRDVSGGQPQFANGDVVLIEPV